MIENTLFNIIVDALNPFKILGKIKAMINPTLDFIDSQIGYDDFEFRYDGRPNQDEIYPNKIYFYKEEGRLYCLTKEITDQYSLIDNPTEDEKNIFIKGIELNKQDLEESVFDEMLNILDDHKKQKQLSIENQSKLYEFMLINKMHPGIKYTWHSNMVFKYNEFEKNFIEKHPVIVKIYNFCKNSINNLCIFATSQTGLRVAAFCSAAAMAFASGGAMPMILLGAYGVGMAVSVIQQANSRMKLNKLEEEADLINRYKVNNQTLGRVFLNKTPLKIDNSIFGKIKRWSMAATVHSSTYFLEVTIPVITAIISPVNAAISMLEIGVFVGLAATGMGVGSYFRTLYEDKKFELKLEIDKAKLSSDIPDYKDIAELKRKIIEQEKSLGKINSEKDDSLKVNYWIVDYWRGLKDVVNPFKQSLEVKDPKIFARTVAGSSMALAAGAAIMSATPEVAISGLGTALVASATTNAVAYKNASVRPELVINEKKEVSRQQEVVIQRDNSKSRNKVIIGPNTRRAILEKSSNHPLYRSQ